MRKITYSNNFILKKTSSILKVVLPLLIGVILVWYSLSKISISELVQYFKDANYLWIGLGVIFGIISHISRAYRWLFMTESLGFKPRFANSLMSVYSAYLVNFTIPRAGEVARASIITNYEGIPFDKTFGTIVAERIARHSIIVYTSNFSNSSKLGFYLDRFGNCCTSNCKPINKILPCICNFEQNDARYYSHSKW